MKFRAQGTTKEIERRTGKALTLETRLPLGEPGDIRRDEVLRSVGLRVRAYFVRAVGRRRARPLGVCTQATKWMVIEPIRQLTT
jgi:hypothetical protein